MVGRWSGLLALSAVTMRVVAMTVSMLVCAGLSFDGIASSAVQGEDGRFKSGVTALNGPPALISGGCRLSPTSARPWLRSRVLVRGWRRACGCRQSGPVDDEHGVAIEVFVAVARRSGRPMPLPYSSDSLMRSRRWCAWPVTSVNAPEGRGGLLSDLRRDPTAASRSRLANLWRVLPSGRGGRD